MVNLIEIIKANRPALVDSSVNAYVNNIRKLHEKMYKTKDVKALSWVGDYQKILEFLEDNIKSYLTVRNFLNALIVLILNDDKFTKALEVYQEKRDNLNDQYQSSQGEMTTKQKENWVDLSDIQQYVTQMNDEVKLLKLNKNVSIGNLMLIQDRFMVKFWITYPVGYGYLGYLEILGQE
jgi:hypothetical protein